MGRCLIHFSNFKGIWNDLPPDVVPHIRLDDRQYKTRGSSYEPFIASPNGCQEHYPQRPFMNLDNLFIPEAEEQQDSQDKTIEENIHEWIYRNTPVISNQRRG